MRIYLPAHLGIIDALGSEMLKSASPVMSISEDSIVFMVPEAMRRRAEAEHRDAVEEAEFTALYAAADHSISLLAALPAVPRQRAVVSIDVPDNARLRAVTGKAAEHLGELAAYAVVVEKAINEVPVVCVHIDEPAAASVIDAALLGDNHAAEAIANLDLLWYDSSEIAELPR